MQHAADIFQYIEVSYNRVRRHSSINGDSPATRYETWLKQQFEGRRAALGLFVGARKSDGRSLQTNHDVF
jgi:hypothetical protein